MHGCVCLVGAGPWPALLSKGDLWMTAAFLCAPTCTNSHFVNIHVLQLLLSWSASCCFLALHTLKCPCGHCFVQESDPCGGRCFLHSELRHTCMVAWVLQVM